MATHNVAVLSLGVLLAAASAVDCGRPQQPSRSQTGHPANVDGDDGNGGADCQSDADCSAGTCNQSTGACETPSTEPTPCTDRNDCTSNEFCHFVQPPSPWEPTYEGVCRGPCMGDPDCSFGQSCLNGVCYTMLPCQPALNNADCPPGEVCQDGACMAPGACIWPEDCPTGWECNVGTCVDPSNISFGGCTASADCSSVQGCQNGTCDCNAAGECVPLSGCETTADCPEGAYCNNAGYCRPAESCELQDELDPCFPMGQICDDGYCVNPEPCGPAGACDEGYVCRYNFSPPGCFPENAAECTRDEQCPLGTYCELFTGLCEAGCRDDDDCAGECDGLTPCVCNAARVCVNEIISAPGESCTHDSQCPGGTRCAFDQPELAAFNDLCNMSGTVGVSPDFCSKSCRQTCNLLVNAIVQTCPDGQRCGGEGGFLQNLILEIFAGLINPNSGGSVCY